MPLPVWVWKFIYNILPDLFGLFFRSRSRNQSSSFISSSSSSSRASLVGLSMGVVSALWTNTWRGAFFFFVGFFLFTMIPNANERTNRAYEDSRRGTQNDRCVGSMTIDQQRLCDDYHYTLTQRWPFVFMKKLRDEFCALFSSANDAYHGMADTWTVFFIWIAGLLVFLTYMAYYLLRAFRFIMNQYNFANITEHERQANFLASRALPGTLQQSLADVMRNSQHHDTPLVFLKKSDVFHRHGNLATAEIAEEQ